MPSMLPFFQELNPLPASAFFLLLSNALKKLCSYLINLLLRIYHYYFLEELA